jgi:hypothetical protein
MKGGAIGVQGIRSVTYSSVNLMLILRSCLYTVNRKPQTWEEGLDPIKYKQDDS